jgi:hypothetical protein
MAEIKERKQRNGKLSLYPLKFEDAVKDLLKVKSKENNKTPDKKVKED